MFSLRVVPLFTSVMQVTRQVGNRQRSKKVMQLEEYGGLGLGIASFSVAGPAYIPLEPLDRSEHWFPERSLFGASLHTGGTGRMPRWQGTLLMAEMFLFPCKLYLPKWLTAGSRPSQLKPIDWVLPFLECMVLHGLLKWQESWGKSCNLLHLLAFTYSSPLYRSPTTDK